MMALQISAVVSLVSFFNRNDRTRSRLETEERKAPQKKKKWKKEKEEQEYEAGMKHRGTSSKQLI
ncbi:uncharacterized protein LOC143212974 isoform X3 [Lasioglossum baleicum]|uniref:uncharacterized protein LOC143212974 isoform X3 n=1 Tax=Lasioglossum baleicum TaxID=434251 RepID=UPI003FCDB456